MSVAASSADMESKEDISKTGDGTVAVRSLDEVTKSSTEEKQDRKTQDGSGDEVTKTNAQEEHNGKTLGSEESNADEVPEKTAEALERSVKEGFLKEFCIRCETYVQIPDAANMLETLILHCQNCAQKSSENQFSCYKCIFNSNFRGDFTKHVTRDHLALDGPKKPEATKLLEEKLLSNSGGQKKTISNENIIPPRKIDLKESDKHRRRSDDSTSITSGSTHSLGPAGYWCIHCTKVIHIEDTKRFITSLVNHSELCSKKKSDTLMCYKCDSSFAVNGALLRHITNTHTNFARPITSPTIAPYERRSPSSQAMPVIQKEPEVTSKVPKRTTGQIEAVGHATKTFRCRYCSHESSSSKALQMHMYEHRIQ